MSTTVKYVDAAEIAKLVRRDLKRAFPTTKFSVRTDKYSMGASVRVSWVDGPAADRVERIVKRYEGATFDGMQDLKTYHESVIDGERVHSMADFVFCSRRVANEDALKKDAETIIRARCAVDGPNMPDEHEDDRFGTFYVRDLARAMVYSLDFPEFGVYAEEWDRAFRIAVLREREEVS